ncbi:MAG: T9SS type A sorting domain-containing protein [Melioribacteraceae bacterium]|nr:T9SS type A sorting domain-containing protein [Melioribacteraceae bacterium]
MADNKMNAQNIITPDNPNIQYYGRWDLTDATAPSYSWPGVYLYAEFEGTSIGIRTADNFNYFNIYIDGELKGIFHGNKTGINNYSLFENLSDGQHSIKLLKRNETWNKFSYNGLILDEGKNLLPPAEKPERKIEFIGDSFTSASGNEYAYQDSPPDVEKYTNVAEGFGPIIADHFGAQFMMSSISGFGMVLDWQGIKTNAIPLVYDRTLSVSQYPKWDFAKWIPNLVVIGLGLNDYSGFGGWNGPITVENRELYKSEYHKFLARLLDIYPGVKILAVAAHVTWIQDAVKEIVIEENEVGNKNIFYADYPYYTGGYVNNGHPTVETHHKIAERIISAIDEIDAWQSYSDSVAPNITKMPTADFKVYDKNYELIIETDTYANLKYSTSDKPYTEMENQFTTTGKREHKTDIECEHGKDYTLYIRGIDPYGNAMDSSAVVKFSVDTTKILLNWKSLNYNEQDWKKGLTPIGSGATGNVTSIEKVTTGYFRKKVTVENATSIVGVGIMIKGNDGAIVYLNGNEIQRINFSFDKEAIYSETADALKTINQMIVINSTNGLKYLKEGENVIAVEIHRSNSNEFISFDSRMYDSKNKQYYKLGDEWTYYDKGNMPAEQIGDKTTDMKNDEPLQGNYELKPNYPNPFNPETTIEYRVAKASLVDVKVFDILGQEIVSLVNEIKDAGNHSVKFDAGKLQLNSGVYFCRFNSGNYTAIQKMLYLK